MELFTQSHIRVQTQQADYQQTQHFKETVLNIHAGVMNILAAIISEQLN